MRTKVIAIALLLNVFVSTLPARAEEPSVTALQAAAQTPVTESLQRTKRALAGEATPSRSGAGAKAVSGMMFALAVVGGLAALGKRYQQRQTNSGNGVAIDLLAKRQLSPKHALFVVEIEGQRLVLGTAGERIQLLSTLDTFEESLDDSFKFSTASITPQKVALG